MKIAEKGQHVMVHYTGRLEDGTVFDTSYERKEPIHFELGAGQMIQGFDDAVLGMLIGDKKTVTLPPELAYGHSNPEYIQMLEKKSFGDVEPIVGQKYMADQYSLTVLEVTETHIKADFNHELAGKTLIFDLELVDVHSHDHH